MKKVLFSHGAGLILLHLICAAFAGDEENSTIPTPKNHTILIDELNMPSSVEEGKEDFVILDCKYQLLNKNTSGLHVKFFLNATENIYQWIYGQKPQALGILQNRLDLTYEASNVDYEKYRALKIIKPTQELSGDYKCRVDTFDDSASKEERMIVYVPVKEMKLAVVESSEENSINLTCFAYGVFPEPRLSLSYGPKGEEKSLDPDEKMTSSQDAVGAFNFSIYKVIPKSNLTLPMEFNCDLKIPNTSYVYPRRNFILGGRVVDADAGGSMLLRPMSSWLNGNGLLIMLLIYSSFVLLLR